MTGIHEIRYTLEHRMLPGWFYGEGQRLTELLTERPLFVYEVLCDILKKEELEAFPDLSQITVKIEEA